MNGWLLLSNALLLVVVAGLATVLLALARQIGVLHERTAPAGIVRTRTGLEPGAAVPTLAAPNLEGQSVSLDAADAGEPIALLFVAVDCPICRLVLPAFLTLTAERTCRAYLVSDGTQIERYAEYGRRYGVETDRYLVSQALALEFQVGMLPALVLIDADGHLLVRETVQGPRALERALGKLDGASRPLVSQAG
ncbi:MAG: redoxin domain-containing protein [Pseudomonadales bacterium]